MLNKFICVLIFFTIISGVGLVNQVYSHPLDITFITFYFKGKTLHGEITIHPYEVSMLLKNNNISDGEVSWKEYYKHKDYIFNYLKNHINIKSNGQNLSFTPVEMPNIPDYELVSLGLAFRFKMKSENVIDKIDIKNDLFIEEYKLQTNKMVFIPKDTEDIDILNKLEELYFTRKLTKITYYVLSIHKNASADDKDTDNDGLLDRLEELYGTDLNNEDTDNDGFGDAIEIFNSWDPLNSELSPGQEEALDYNPELKKDKKDNNKVSTTTNSNKNETYLDKNQNSSNNTTNGQNLKDNNDDDFDYDKAKKNRPNYDPYNSEMLRNTLKTVEEELNKNSFSSYFIIIFFVFLLGFLHALETGHGKTILLAYIADKNTDNKKIVKFILSNTLTHVGDLLLLAFALKLFDIFGDIYQYLNYIQIIGIIGLFFISIYLLVKAVKKYFVKDYKVQNDKTDKTDKTSKSNPILLGILIGLMPCPFGWAIFMFLISINRMDLIFPLILVFALGILVLLAVFGFTFSIFKGQIYKKFAFLIKISPIISSLLMLVFSLYLIVSISKTFFGIY